MPLPDRVTGALYRAYAASSPWYRAGKLGHWRQLFDEADQWCASELQVFQLGLLRQLLGAALTTAFYRRRLTAVGIEAKTCEFGDFRRLPVLRKSEINAGPSELWVKPAPRFRPGATSGTTGVPMRVRTSAAMDAAGRAARWRMFGWYGIGFGARTVNFKGGNQARNRTLAVTWLAASKLLGQTLRDAFRFPLESSLSALSRERPEVVLGYPNVLAELASGATSVGFDLGSLGARLIVLGGESISAAQRAAIGSAFRCSVAALYGSHEGHYMAMECPSGRLHVQETVLLEVVDHTGRPAPIGQEGEVVITPLLGTALPLLRYQLGDRGRLLGSCPCGRPTPTLALDVSRVADLFTLGDGRKVSSQLFQPMIHNAFGLRFGVDPSAYRVVQLARDRFEFQLMLPANAPLPSGTEAFFGELVRAALGPAVQVCVVGVTGLRADDSGKRRCFIPLEEAARFRLTIE
jgi:phenylacetate-CoA ligase